MESKALALMLVLAFLVLTAAEVVCGSVAVVGSVSDDTWPMFRHDSAHTGYSVSLAPAGSVVQLWNYTFETGSLGVASVPVVVEGYVYVGSSDCNVYCFAASTGLLVWSFPAGDSVAVSPAVVGGRVFVGSRSGVVFCLNVVDGVQIWNSSLLGLSEDSVDAALTVVDDRVFVESWSGSVFCLDALNGNPIWNYSTGSRAYGSSSPAYSGGYVFVGDSAGIVCCLNASSGMRIWNFTSGGAVYSPAVADGCVSFGSADGNAYCLNVSNGAKLWNYTTQYNSNGPSHNYHFGNTVSDPAVAYGYIFVGSSDSLVYCLNASSGSQVWNYTTDAQVYAAPSVADGCVFVGSYDGKLYCLNAYNGSEIWTYPAGVYSPVNAWGSAGSPAISDGVVYVVGQGVLYALGTPSNSSSFPTTEIVAVTIIIIVVVAAIVVIYKFKKGTK